MRTMDYIGSTDLCYLVCDTLKLIDKRPIEHGMRVAYMMMKLLQSKGGYDEYEAAEFVFLTMLHDIGVYNTERMLDERMYDAKGSNKAHAVYGSLFLKKLSPFGERADIILYHHMPFRELNRLNYEYNRIASYMSLLEDVDALYCRDGENMELHDFERAAGDQYSPEAVMLLLRCVRMEGMLTKLRSGEYEQELRDYMDYVIFTNEEKENMIRFVMHCFGLKEKLLAVKAIMCCCAVEEVAEDIGLTSREKEKLDYSAMLHDIGMLAADKEVLKQLRDHVDAARSDIDDHIEVGISLLKKYFMTDITEIISAHHERLDGSGYPKGLRENRMTIQQQILQTADLLIGLMNSRTKGQGLSKKEIVDVLLRKSDKKQLSTRVVSSMIRRYEIIDRRVHSETKDYLETHMRINNSYKMLMENR